MFDAYASSDFPVLREYDSLIHLIKCCSLNLRAKSFRCSKNPLQLSCFDACEQYVALGWNSGDVSILRREGNKIFSFPVIDNRKKWFATQSFLNLPTSISIHRAVSLVIVCSCVCLPKSRVFNSNARFDSEQFATFVIRFPISNSGSLLHRRMKQSVIRGLHHSILSTTYVSPNADLILTGDQRGLIIASRFNNQTFAYNSSVLTAIPAAVLSIQVQGSLLLITGRPFLCNVACDEDELTEIMPRREVFFIYDIPSRSLIPVDFTGLIPSELNLRVSCIRPAWLPRQKLSHSHQFICSVISTSPSCSQHGTTEASAAIAIIFAVNNLTVSIQRLVYLQPGLDLSTVPRISVLPSVISLSQATTQSVGHSSSVVFHGYAERSIHVLSSNILLLWSSPPSTHITTSSFSNIPLPSVLVVLQLIHNDHIDPGQTYATSYFRLLTYSDQLGVIRSVVTLWLKPRLGPIDSIPTQVVLRAEGFGGVGLEIWIQRAVFTQFVGDAPPLLLLSTRPLCASKLALAPTAELSSLFFDHIPHTGSHWSIPSLDSSSHLRSILNCRLLEGKHIVSSNSADNLSKVQVVTEFEMGFEASDDLAAGSPSHSSLSSFGVDDRVTSGDDKRSAATVDDEGPTEVDRSEQLMVHATPSRNVVAVDFASGHPVAASVTGVDTSGLVIEVHEIEKCTAASSLVDLPQAVMSTQPDHSSFTADDDSAKSTEPVTLCVSSNPTVEATCPVNCSLEESAFLEDSWFVYHLPKRTNSLKLEDLGALFDRSTTEVVPFVSCNGRPGVAISQPSSTSPSWILAPKSFGPVQSIHVSPNGQLVWCLRTMPKLSGSQDDDVMSVDACLEGNGLRGLARAWLSGNSGNWESNVLLRVTSVDLHDSFVVFTSSAGSVKVQFGLSPKRPCCQSYTWLCPDFHVLQVSAADSGLVWALALSKHPKDSDLTTGQLCLLAAALPSAHYGRIWTSCASNGFMDELRSSRWVHLMFPSLLQPSIQKLVSPTSLAPLARLVNTSFQLTFSTQVAPSKTDDGETECSTVGWLLVRSPVILCDSTAEEDEAGNLYGCAFCLPNFREFYEVDDLKWCQVSLGGFGSVTSSQTTFQTLIKRMGSSQSSLPLLRIPTYSVAANPWQVLPAPSSSQSLDCHPKPMWLVLQGPPDTYTTLARVYYSLSVYRWAQYNVHVQTVQTGSLVTDNVVCYSHIWKFPLLIDGLCAQQTQDQTTAGLWSLNVITNELFLHCGSDYSRSLALPTGKVKYDDISAMCVVPDILSGVFHLMVATRSGQLWSRLGLSSLSPTGITWTEEVCPHHWSGQSDSISQTAALVDRSSELHHFFTSLSCVGQKLWATDSLGYLCVAEIHVMQHNHSRDMPRRLAGRWSMHASSVQTGSRDSSSDVFFLSVSAANWISHQSGISLWTIGLPCNAATKSKLTTQISQSVNHRSPRSPIAGFVYTRCWNPAKNCFNWLHVASPPARSIHVTANRVWLVTTTHPVQLFVRRGLFAACPLPSDATDYAAPLEQNIGRSWHLVPHPDPLYHNFSLDTVTACSTRPILLHPVDVLGVSQTGVFLTMSINQPLIFGRPSRSERSEQNRRLDCSQEHS